MTCIPEKLENRENDPAVLNENENEKENKTLKTKTMKPIEYTFLQLAFYVDRGQVALTGLTPSKAPKLADVANAVGRCVVRFGGHVINPFNGGMPNDGYVFSERKDLEYRFPVAGEAVIANQVVTFAMANSEHLNHPSRYLSAWVEDGEVYLDVVTVSGNKQDALDRAKKSDQLAIYDIANERAINVK